MKIETPSKLFLICFLFLGFGIYFQIVGNEIENQRYNLAVLKHDKKVSIKKEKGETVFSHSFNYNRQMNWAEYLAILFFIISGGVILGILFFTNGNMKISERENNIKIVE